MARRDQQFRRALQIRRAFRPDLSVNKRSQQDNSSELQVKFHHRLLT